MKRWLPDSAGQELCLGEGEHLATSGSRSFMDEKLHKGAGTHGL